MKLNAIKIDDEFDLDEMIDGIYLVRYGKDWELQEWSYDRFYYYPMPIKKAVGAPNYPDTIYGPLS